MPLRSTPARSSIPYSGALIANRLDPKVYLIDRLPISVHLREVLLVAAITMALCLAATLIPTLKAARLRPVEGLRSE